MTSAFCFLPYLENKTGLSELRVRADLADGQATRLTNFSAIQSLSLFWGSWNVMNMLPRWSRSIQQTLTSLVFHVSALLLAIAVSFSCAKRKMCPSLNETVLESVLADSPQLVLLHVVRCPKVNSTSILCLSNYTPMLRSLAITFVVRGQLQSFKPTIMQAGSGFAYVSANCPYPPPRTYTGSTRHR